MTVPPSVPSSVPGTEVPDLRGAFDFAPIGMAVLTLTGAVILANAALGELLQRPAGSLAGTTLFEVTHPEDLIEARRNCDLMQSGVPRIVRHECRFLRADGRIVWVLVSTALVPTPRHQPDHLIMHVEDIDDRKQLEAELTHQALHDPLTGLANRALLTRRINEAVADEGGRNRPLCLFYVDLDAFKAINDRHGHLVGDRVLQLVAARITAAVRPHDVCARIGGDEFAVLCTDTDRTAGHLIAARLRRAVSEPFTIDDVVMSVTAAVGIGVAGDDATRTWQGLLALADTRMYAAKRGPATT